jgi:hypothetical protein
MVPIKFAENGIILEESNYKINQYEHSYFKILMEVLFQKVN